MKLKICKYGNTIVLLLSEKKKTLFFRFEFVHMPLDDLNRFMKMTLIQCTESFPPIRNFFLFHFNSFDKTVTEFSKYSFFCLSMVFHLYLIQCLCVCVYVCMIFFFKNIKKKKKNVMLWSFLRGINSSRHHNYYHKCFSSHNIF